MTTNETFSPVTGDLAHLTTKTGDSLWHVLSEDKGWLTLVCVDDPAAQQEGHTMKARKAWLQDTFRWDGSSWVLQTAPEPVSEPQDAPEAPTPASDTPSAPEAQDEATTASRITLVVHTVDDGGKPRRKTFKTLAGAARSYVAMVGLSEDGVSDDGVVRLEVIGTTIAKLLEERENADAPKVMGALRQARAHYVPGQNANGDKTLTCGDDLAAMLLSLTPEDVSRVAASLLDLDEDLYDHLNPGQVRMNWGNRLRAALKKGKVTEDQVASAIAAL